MKYKTKSNNPYEVDLKYEIFELTEEGHLKIITFGWDAHRAFDTHEEALIYLNNWNKAGYEMGNQRYVILPVALKIYTGT